MTDKDAVHIFISTNYSLDLLLLARPLSEPVLSLKSIQGGKSRIIKYHQKLFLCVLKLDAEFSKFATDFLQ